jgi:hypothetical protein
MTRPISPLAPWLALLLAAIAEAGMILNASAVRQSMSAGEGL